MIEVTVHHVDKITGKKRELARVELRRLHTVSEDSGLCDYGGRSVVATGGGAVRVQTAYLASFERTKYNVLALLSGYLQQYQNAEDFRLYKDIDDSSNNEYDLPMMLKLAPIDGRTEY